MTTENIELKYQDYFSDYYALEVPENVINSFISEHLSYAFEMNTDFLMEDFLNFIGVGMKYPSCSASSEKWDEFDAKLKTQCEIYGIAQLD